MEAVLSGFLLLMNFVIVPAATYASQLTLGALGVTLIYGILRFSNFAHGDTMALGAMVVILVTWGLKQLGISFGTLPTALLALPFGIIATIAYVLICDRLVFRAYRAQKAKPQVFLIVSIGVMFVTNGIVRFIIGPAEQNFADGERFILKARTMKRSLGLAEGFSLKVSQGLSIAFAMVTVTALFWFLMRTRTGKAMRATSDNEDLALLCGIDPHRIVMITWAIVGILACIAGTMYGLDKSFRPFNYFQLLLPIFAAAILGGLGNPLGAVIGGIIVAFSEIILTYAYKKLLFYWWPSDWQPDHLVQFLGTEYKFAISFMILVIVLIFMPRGIFKGKSAL
ncbi:MAG: branched-chain amino acid ABC transporter permease [Pseudomonadota bacterium]